MNHLRGGCGRQGEHRSLGKELSNLGDFQIGRAEIVTPLGDAVCLVHRDHPNRHPGKILAECVGHQAFGRHIQEAAFRVEQGGGEGILYFTTVHPRKYGHRLDVPFPQMRHLVLHQSDQRGDDEAETAQGDGRHLKADGLAATGGQQRQRVAPLQHRKDNILLHGTEPVVAPICFQYLMQARRNVVFHHSSSHY